MSKTYKKRKQQGVPIGQLIETISEKASVLPEMEEKSVELKRGNPRSDLFRVMVYWDHNTHTDSAYECLQRNITRSQAVHSVMDEGYEHSLFRIVNNGDGKYSLFGRI